MLPVILNMIPIGPAGMGSDHGITRHDHDLTGIQAATDPVAHPLAGDRVAVAIHAHQAGAGDPRQLLHLTIERGRARHPCRAFLLQQLGDGEALVLGMLEFRPACPAPLP